MKTSRFSETSKPHLASVLAVVCMLLGCSRQAAPTAAHESHSQSTVAAKPAMPARAAQASPVHSGAAGGDHGSWATAANFVPEALNESCAKVNGLVRSVADSAPASTKITEFSGPRAITFQYQYANARAAGCEFVTRGSDTESSSGLFDAME